MNKDGEPSVEDILRSIKQVISREDEGEAGDASNLASGSFAPRQTFAPRQGFAANQAFTAPTAANAPEGDDVFDLRALGEGAPASAEDLPEDVIELPAAFAVSAQDKAEPQPRAMAASGDADGRDETEGPDEPEAEESLIAGAAAVAVREQLSALSDLSATAPPPGPANPLEEIVREMLRPMLKDWLDANLQGIIERIVQDEIARITGRR